MIALTIGAVISLATLAWVLAPIFQRQPMSSGKARAVCARCGVRPEADAVFCSTCGAAINAGGAPVS